jgi:hypothetical protein
MKQSAVEFISKGLFNILQEAEDNNIFDVGTQNFKRYIQMFSEQAKEMEKQQIIYSHLQGSKNSIIEVSKYIKVNNTLDTIKNIEKGIDEHCDGIKYYNETFKNK